MKPPALGNSAKTEMRGSRFGYRKFADLLHMNVHQGGRQENAGFSMRCFGSCQGTLDVVRGSDFNAFSLYGDRSHGRLRRSKLRRVDSGITKNGDAREPRQDLFEQLQLFATQLGEIKECSRDIATRMGKTFYVPQRNGITLQI